MQTRISTLIQSHKELTSAVSHEIKTPVSRAKFANEMMVQKMERGDAVGATSYANSIADDLNEINSLVSEMLNYAKLEHADPTLELSAVMLNALIQAKIDSIAPAQPDVTFVFTPDKMYQLHCDGHFVDRAVQNLLINAVKYCRSQVSVSCAIQTVNQPDSEQKVLEIAVEDDGAGINEDELNRVFQPFSRLDQSRARTSGGFGLGLAIVKRVMQWHDGDALAFARSELGGARFELRFPITTA